MADGVEDGVTEVVNLCADGFVTIIFEHQSITVGDGVLAGE